MGPSLLGPKSIAQWALSLLGNGPKSIGPGAQVYWALSYWALSLLGPRPKAIADKCISLF
jgi:hypothetical protein